MSKNNKRKVATQDEEEVPKAARQKTSSSNEVAAAAKKSAQETHFDALKAVVQRVGGVQYTMEHVYASDAHLGDDAEEEGLTEVLDDAEGLEDIIDDEDNEEHSNDEENDDNEDDEEDDVEGDDDDDDDGGEDEEIGELEEVPVESDEDAEREADAEVVYTDEEIAQFRHVIVTQRRDDYLQSMTELLLGDQANEEVLQFDDSFAAHVLKVCPREIESIAKKASAADRFDALFALTKNLQNYELWLTSDDVKALQRCLRALGDAWKSLRSLSDEELGIDSEFTRPGFEKMLENFAKLVQETATQRQKKLLFKY